MTLAPVVPSPPAQEQPIADSGDHSPAWSAYHQSMSDTLAAQPTQLRTGTVAGDEAAAGMIGEVIPASVPSSAAVPLTSGLALDVTTIDLTPGDWDVSGNVILSPAGSTITQDFRVGISDVINALPGIGPYAEIGAVTPAGRSQALATGSVRKNITAAATVHLAVQCFFTAGAMGAYGTLNARRMR